MNASSIDAIDLGEAILMALPLAVRAAGFPTATHIMCSRPDYDSLTLHPFFRLEEVRDGEGVIADREHTDDRSPEAAAAFDGLASIDLHLDRLAAVDDRIEPDDMYVSPYDTTFWFAHDCAVPDHERWIAVEEDEDISADALRASLEEAPSFTLSALQAQISHLIEEYAIEARSELDAFLVGFGADVREVWPTAAEVDLWLEDGGDAGRYFLRVRAVRDAAGEVLTDDDEEIEVDLGLDDIVESHGDDLDGATITVSADG